MTQYSSAFKARVLQRLVGPRAISANRLAVEVGVPQVTLSRWLASVRSVPGMATPGKKWTGAQKLRVVLAAHGLSETDLGALLRREGLHAAQLEEWRAAAETALEPPSRRREKSGPSPETTRIHELERDLRRKKKALAEAAALLILKKSGGVLGGRGRFHGPDERQMIVADIDAAVTASATRAPACALVGISVRTEAVERWRGAHPTDARHGPEHVPANEYSAVEHRAICATVTAVAYRDLSPHQIVPRLADQGVYLASESTIYRVLRAEDLLTRRGRAKAPVPRVVTAQIAHGPNQVWSWDITYVPTPVRGRFLYLYLILDVWSRKIVAAHVYDTECAAHAAALFERTCQRAALDPARR